MRQTRFMSLLLAPLFATVVQAQESVFTGRVVDADGEPIIGASVVQKGSTSGQVTDLDGRFSFRGKSGVPLVISYLGYTSQTVTGGQDLRVVLQEEQASLNEVVVIGYGVQKKSVVTASIAKVSADDLAGTAPVRVDNALKGLAAGVTVTSSSGQPGAASQIRIRGVGTVNDATPLYIVDGMPIEGGIDYLNPSDIQSIEVLKDAASGAIYGTRAANGVVLVTTKGGQKGRAHVNYNFSYGWQNPWKHRDVLNATEYAVMMNEGAANAGLVATLPYYADPYSYGKGTDWQEEVFNKNAGVANHEVNVSGASDKVNYYLSMGYFHQDGIVGGNFDRSNYRRMTLRSNTKINIFDDTHTRDWLNKLDVAVNLSYARVKSKSIDANSQWGSPLGSALYLSPILTPTVSGAAAEAQLNNPNYGGADHMLYDATGNLYTIPGSAYQEMNNPLAMLSLPGDQGWSHKFVANFSAELALGWGFKYRVSYGADLSFWGSDGYTRLYYLSGNNKADITNAHQSSSRGTVWQLENVVTWDKQFGDHTFNVVLGQSAMQNTGHSLGGTLQNLKDLSKPYMNNTSADQSRGEMSAWGGPAYEHTLSSYFLRASYNYAERYMLQATVRRDGSSRFGANNKYATFPSFSAGWNIINEPYFHAPSWLSTLKLRASWGKNGNDKIGDFTYAAWTAAPYNAVLGAGESVWTGVQAGQLSNPDLKWEQSIQTDLGIDLGFFDNALTFTADYYHKKTSGMIIPLPIPKYVGAAAPYGNAGDMTNEGVEFEAGYKFHVGSANFQIKGNASYLHNRLDNLGNSSGYIPLQSMQSVGEVTRGTNGLPFPYFYGYKTAGVFQNYAEVQNYKNANGGMIQPNAVAGDVRFVDVDGDGAITAADRTMIGKGMPDWTYGFALNAEWQGFDFMAMFQGTIGNDIFDATRRTDVQVANLPSYMLNRWTGEGTSNKYPRFVIGDGTNWQSSDLYITDGSYFRLKNIQLGYTLPKAVTSKFFVSKLRFYVAAENLFTLTKYAGYDPEISSGSSTEATALGVDYGVYPQSRTITVGVNIGF
ncbi:MAG: TonB-dependent receptor [Prevotella sp.]|nr:TonB-dependent receptor [Prevotella sp.]